jgi:hypothetical protein
MTWRWLRNPMLHFVLIGVGLYGVSLLWSPSGPEQDSGVRDPIRISADRIQAMEADFERRWGKAPSSEEISALIEQNVEDEMLYREARLLALDYEDASVKRRLVEKMRAVGESPARDPDALVREARELGLDDDIVIRRLLVEKMRILLAQDPAAQPLTESELVDYLERNRDRFEQAAELSFSHVFLSEGTRGANLEKDAQAALAQLRTFNPPYSAVLELSDPFLLGLEIRAYSKSRVTARFGTSFAEQVFALQPGLWSNPIASPYGLHLVRIEEKAEPRLPGLAAVRQQVAAELEKERAEAQLARGLAHLRELYEIRVDLPLPDPTVAAQPGS